MDIRSDVDDSAGVYASVISATNYSDGTAKPYIFVLVYIISNIITLKPEVMSICITTFYSAASPMGVPTSISKKLPLNSLMLIAVEENGMRL